MFDGAPTGVTQDTPMGMFDHQQPGGDAPVTTDLLHRPVEAPRGGTRWRRTAVLLVPGLIVAGVLVATTVRGGIPINLVVSGQDLKLTSNGAEVELPRGITLYPSTIQMKNGGDTRGVVIAGLPEAVLTEGLCISLVVTLPWTGTYTVRLHTSGRTTAKDMTLDAAGIAVGAATLRPGGGSGDPIMLGPDAVVDPGQLGDEPPGRFGVQAPGNGTLRALQADAQGAVIAGTVALRGLSVKTSRGSGVANGECY